MRKIIVLFVLIIFFAETSGAQEIPLENLLKMAETASQKYVESFKNLVAEEQKTIEVFKRDETLDDRRIIKSNFIVYQQQNGGGDISEFRTVLEVNGRKIVQSDEDVVKFFARLAKSDNANEEFGKVKKESVRYDGRFIVWGMTLGKDFLLQPRVRRFFDYKIVGREKFAGRDVYVVEYRQKEYSPYILVNPTREESRAGERVFRFDTVMPDNLRPTNPRLNGTMRLDAENGEMWKNEYRVSIQPPILAQPIITSESYYEYQPSEFGIAVPKIIKIENSRISGKPGRDLRVSKFAATTLSYSNFSRLNSEAKSYEADPEK